LCRFDQRRQKDGRCVLTIFSAGSERGILVGRSAVGGPEVEADHSHARGDPRAAPTSIAACASSPNSELAARVLPCPKLIAGGSNEAIAPGAVSILARRNNGNEYLWRTGRSRCLQLAGQRTRGSNIGRGKWTRHCWRTDAVTALAAGPVAQGTVPAKS
jgi:hypothetical protein